jgi:hypothetical protein
LRGNTRRVKGPTAAEVAGRIYRRLREESYFANPAPVTALASGLASNLPASSFLGPPRK